MVYDLIPAENVTLNKLLGLLKSAYIDAEIGNNDFIRIRILNEQCFLIIDDDNNHRIELIDFLSCALDETRYEEIVRKAYSINRSFNYCKFKLDQLDKDEDEKHNFRVIVEWHLRFNKGLNFHQLVDDIHFYMQIKKLVFQDFVEFVKESDLLK